MEKLHNNEPTSKIGFCLVESFWRLAQDHNFGKITVKMVVSEAGCSRGSFYYHFTDINHLACAALKNELILSGAIPRVLLGIIANDSEMTDLSDNGLHMRRVKLAVQQWPVDIFFEAFASSNLAIWQYLLSKDADSFTDETLTILDFLTAGMSSFVRPQLQSTSEDGTRCATSAYLREVFNTIAQQTCEAQDTPLEQFHERLNNLRAMGWVPAAV
ncbi:MAG: TetR/AcrR family transcriptional regulator [Eggerthellaceae bacterium]|nr:TetR/AcrR family transcriptional regulator [Eggerthellaceae bacterium]